MATTISGGPSARRVASSSSTMPTPATTRSACGQAGPFGQLVVEEEEVAGAEGADQGEDPVLDRDAVARRALEGRPARVGEEDREGEVDGAGLGVVQDRQDVGNHEGQRRGDPQLKQRPEQGHASQQQAHRSGRAAQARLDGGQDLGRFSFGGSLLPAGDLFAHRHRFPPAQARQTRLGPKPGSALIYANFRQIETSVHGNPSDRGGPAANNAF